MIWKSRETAYLTFKKEQKEAREVQREIDAQANRPWHEKAWDATKTFTGKLLDIMIIREQQKASIPSLDESCQKLNEMDGMDAAELK